jgi:hypothetical protein
MKKMEIYKDLSIAKEERQYRERLRLTVGELKPSCRTSFHYTDGKSLLLPSFLNVCSFCVD